MEGTTRPHRKTVGIRYPQWSSFGPAILGGVVDFMRGHEPWRLVTENNSYGEMEGAEIGSDWRGDGLILFRSTEDELEAYRRHGIAVVLTSTEGPDLGFPRVVPDNDAIGRLAARHLLSCGLTEFAFLARGETFYREAQFAPGFRIYARERLRGFLAELDEHSVEPHIHYLRGRPLWQDHTWREVQTEVIAFLESLPQPCGMFAIDDSLAAVVVRACDTLRCQVPTELALLGYGNDHTYCYSTYPALSSIEHPARQIGELAAGLLQQQMNGEEVSGRTTVAPGEVVQRESSDTLSIDDPIIRDLVSWIRKTAAVDSIRVTDLAERSGLSLTTIKERFNRCMGHSPKHEIKCSRLRHLERLLRREDMTLGEVATRMKFTSAHEMSRFYSGATGERPSAFRERIASKDHQPGRATAVIFDMDGTLFDSEPIYFKAYQAAYAEQGGTLTWDTYQRVHVGTSNKQIEEALNQDAPAGFNLEKLRQRWREHWNQLVTETPLTPLPGVEGLINQLREHGFPMALASSSDRREVDACLRQSGLAEVFQTTIAGDEVHAAKPDPSLFLRAAEALGVEACRCLVIEDSLAGVQAANRAGMTVVHIGSMDGLPQPEKIWTQARSLAEIEWPIIRNWLDGMRELPTDLAR